MQAQRTYKIAGSVTYISQYELIKAGYPYEVTDWPVMVYSENGTLDEKLFIKTRGLTIDAKYEYIPETIIDKKYTMKETKENFPELFL